MRNDEDASWLATPRPAGLGADRPTATAGPSSSNASGVSSDMLGPGAFTGSERRFVPGPSVRSSRVRVEQLANPTYRNRCVRFAGIVGRVVGIAHTAALGLGADGRAHSANGPRMLVLTDAASTDHHLPFTSEDEADILD